MCAASFFGPVNAHRDFINTRTSFGRCKRSAEGDIQLFGFDSIYIHIFHIFLHQFQNSFSNPTFVRHIHKSSSKHDSRRCMLCMVKFEGKM